MTQTYDPTNRCSECGEELPMQKGGWYMQQKGPMCIDCFVTVDPYSETDGEVND